MYNRDDKLTNVDRFVHTAECTEITTLNFYYYEQPSSNYFYILTIELVYICR